MHTYTKLGHFLKLTYLQDSLPGDPKDLLQNAYTSGEPFNAVWNRLLTHYDRNRVVIYSHVTELLTKKKMSNESANELKHFINSVANNLQSLQTLGSSVDEWDHFFVPLVTLKLDQASLTKWETDSASKV